MFFVLLMFFVCPDRTAYVYVGDTSLHIECDDFYTINKRYVEHEYVTKVDDEIMEIWIKSAKFKVSGDLYIDNPEGFAAALYALEGRPIVIGGDVNGFFNKMRVKVEPYY